MDGERMKQQAEQEYLDEMERERQRKLRLKQASEDAQLANQRLRAHREMLKEKERLEDVKREEEERKKQLRDAKRMDLQRQKKENAQARKQRMIDLATNNLVKLEQRTRSVCRTRARKCARRRTRSSKSAPTAVLSRRKRLRVAGATSSSASSVKGASSRRSPRVGHSVGAVR